MIGHCPEQLHHLIGPNIFGSKLLLGTWHKGLGRAVKQAELDLVPNAEL